MPDADLARDMAFGQDGRITFVDRAGVWLSGHQIRRTVGSIDGKDVADFGCGFEATYMRSVLARVGSATLVDIALADDLKSLRNVTAIEGELPGVLAALPDQSLDVVLCMSVLEHLWEPGETLAPVLPHVLQPVQAQADNLGREGSVAEIFSRDHQEYFGFR